MTAVMFWFESLPVEELRVYRHLRRQACLPRDVANFVMWGRYMVHGHGRVHVRVQGVEA